LRRNPYLRTTPPNIGLRPLPFGIGFSRLTCDRLRCLENAKIYQFQVAVAEESGNLKRGLTLKCLNYLIKSAVLELSSEFFYFTNILWDL